MRSEFKDDQLIPFAINYDIPDSKVADESGMVNYALTGIKMLSEDYAHPQLKFRTGSIAALRGELKRVSKKYAETTQIIEEYLASTPSRAKLDEQFGNEMHLSDSDYFV